MNSFELADRSGTAVSSVVHVPSSPVRLCRASVMPLTALLAESVPLSRQTFFSCTPLAACCE